MFAEAILTLGIVHGAISLVTFSQVVLKLNSLFTHLIVSILLALDRGEIRSLSCLVIDC